MVPLSQILTRIRRRYEAESGGSSERWTDARITDFVNEGLECLAEATGFYERYCTIPVGDGRIYYDVRGFTPETIVDITSVWSSSRNDWLKPGSIEDLHTTWENATGDPQMFFTRGIYWIGVYPNSGTGYLRVHFKGVPPRFSHPQAVLMDLPDDRVTALEDYALHEMTASDRQTKRSILHWSEYAKREKSFKEFMDRRLVASRAGRFGRLSGRLS